MRRVRRFVVVGVLLLFLFSAATAHWLAGDNSGGWSKPPEWTRAIVAFCVIFLVTSLIWRIARSMASPVGDVMSAADRVAKGDYSARVASTRKGTIGRLVDSFNEMSSRLESNENQRRQLLADVAHELRTPLAIVRGNIEGMLDGVYPRDDEHLVPIVDQTAHMSRLLDDLRTLSVADAGVLKLHKEPTDIANLCCDVVNAFSSQAEARGISLTENVADLPEIEIDPVRLREILSNLVQNALRYTPSGGSVGISAKLSDDRGRLILVVTDTGAGIDPADLPYIFDRFAKSADSGGSGLGLAIAKRLVEAHGGTISATSVPGVKTTFRLELPAEPA